MEKADTRVRALRVDDRALCDVVFAICGNAAIVAAHRLRLFQLLAGRPRTLAEICDALQIQRRAAEALLGVATAAGFVTFHEHARTYRLTPTSEDYLLPEGPTYFGDFWDLIAENEAACTIEGIVRAAQTNRAQTYGGADLFEQNEKNSELGRKFTRAMHSVSMAAASAWPRVLDLSLCRSMLDVAGGSAAHAIGAASHWQHLHVKVFDLAPICAIADDYIREHNLEKRIQTYAGDMWIDPFPAADLHFYSNIFHDWTPEKCKFLAQKTFESLVPGGRIVLHEVLYEDTKAGPFAAAAFSVLMLGWTEGEQYSGRELSTLLSEIGFKDIRIIPAFGYYSIITAIKR